MNYANDLWWRNTSGLRTSLLSPVVTLVGRWWSSNRADGSSVGSVLWSMQALIPEFHWTMRSKGRQVSKHSFICILLYAIHFSEEVAYDSIELLLPFLTLFASTYHVPTISNAYPKHFQLHNLVATVTCQMNLCPWTCCRSRWEWLKLPCWSTMLVPS